MVPDGIVAVLNLRTDVALHACLAIAVVAILQLCKVDAWQLLSADVASHDHLYQ